MITHWQTTLWRQFGGAIDMLENAIRACPENIWNDRSRKPEYWYIVYHTVFFLDFYLTESEDKFAPPPGYSLSELDPSGILPERVYSQAELLTYLDHGRNKCRQAILRLTEENAHKRCAFDRPDVTNAELILYTLRHVQHHAGQLNLILRQTIDSSPGWVRKTKISL
jgi:hypothetical protein